MAREKTTLKTTVNGHAFELGFSQREAPHWYYPKGGGRGYMTSTWREYDRRPRLYVDFKGETLLDNLMNRTSRPARELGKIVRAALKELGLEGTIHWSQYAGCSCPCSPGFIWKDAPQIAFETGPSRRYDAWVTISDAPAVKTDPASTARREARAKAIVADPTLPPEMLAVKL